MLIKELFMKYYLVPIIVIFMFCASNITMLGKAMPQISETSVREYNKMPNGSKEIAIFEVNSSYVEPKREIVSKAASMGANGYVILNKNELQNQENPLDILYPVAYRSPVDNSPVFRSSFSTSYKIITKLFFSSDTETIDILP
jgi:hypothetical protein